IDSQQGVGVEGVLVAWGDAPGSHVLALILCQLVIVVGDLDPVARGEQVEVERVLPVGLQVKMIEEGLVVAYVVKRGELRSVEEAAAPDTFDCQEVPRFRAAEADSHGTSNRAE